jgi:hypothetical protein
MNEWTMEPPNQSGTYWHWSGDYDDAPFPLFIGMSAGNSFVQWKQGGIEEPVDCNKFGGWWLELHDPTLPSREIVFQEHRKRCIE